MNPIPLLGGHNHVLTPLPVFNRLPSVSRNCKSRYTHSRGSFSQTRFGCLQAFHRQSRRHAAWAVRSSATEDSTMPPGGTEVLELQVGGRKVVLEAGEIGRQANGAIMLRDGETVLYTTACCSKSGSDSEDFVPFTVKYSERFSAIGKTSGSYFKREGSPTTGETITSRLVDRPLRPMLPKGWTNDTQVLSWVMSYDMQHSPEPLAIIAAGAALAISDIPLTKAVAGVRVGLLDDGFVVNPTIEQQGASQLDLIVAGTADAILMIEGFCKFLEESQMVEAVRVGAEAISYICKEVDSWAARIGKPKRTDLVAADRSLDAALMQSDTAEDIREAYRRRLGKKERSEVLVGIMERALESHLASTSGAQDTEVSSEAKRDFASAFHRVEAEVMRKLILEEGIRADGRGVTDVRPIRSRAGLLPRTHGSVLFTRGETQAIAVTTLGAHDSAMRQNGVAGDGDDGPRKFYLQYNFPPSCVGETGRVGAPSRREVGHGMLAERALQPIIPDEEEFPYTIRLESTITESNGSSSMASVCGGCLSLQDAGVPIKQPIAGVAMGLILGVDGSHKVLTDILGSEDALGDMDFKVAGSQDGITAFQMDIKVEGITLDVVAEALQQAKQGRLHILGEMAKCQPAPRNEMGQYTPRVLRVHVDSSKVGMVIGAGGKTIRSIREDSRCSSIQMVSDQDGVFEVVGDTQEAVEQAASMIRNVIEEPEIGRIYRDCKVVAIERFGVFVEFLMGKQGLVHISELDLEAGDLNAWDLGDSIDVKLLDADNGKFRLSRRRALMEDQGITGDNLPQSPQSRPPPPPGTIIKDAVVTETRPYGVFVEVPSIPNYGGLVHVSELWAPHENRRGQLEIGTVISVAVLEQRDGKNNFSRKLALAKEAALEKEASSNGADEKSADRAAARAA